MKIKAPFQIETFPFGDDVKIIEVHPLKGSRGYEFEVSFIVPLQEERNDNTEMSETPTLHSETLPES